VIRNVNPTDPYVAQVGWRYLLRAIEYCREFGLRVNIVLHAAPGSQNGWNHRYSSSPSYINMLSGRQGVIGFLNGYAMVEYFI
jgi:glucan 1,3-beta-glucosidase